MSRILIVEDDIYLREGLQELLSRQGYQVDAAQDCAQAMEIFDPKGHELMILDLMLPDGSGMDLCRMIRRDCENLPIMFLTARDDEWEIVKGLDAGADDYLTKPFRSMELLSRVRALLRRYRPNRFERGGLAVDLERMSVTKNGQLLYLTKTEFQLLKCLMSQPGRTLTRAVILQNIWDDAGNFIDDNTLSVHISRLRDKIGAEHIVTHRGIGYRWEDGI